MSEWVKINDGLYRYSFGSTALEVYTDDLGQWVVLGIWPACGVRLKDRYKTVDEAMRAAVLSKWFGIMEEMSNEGLLVPLADLPCGS